MCFFSRWLALFLSLKAAYRLHHIRFWREKSKSETAHAYLSKSDFILWVNSPLSFPNIHSSPNLKVIFVFIIMVFIYKKQCYIYATEKLHTKSYQINPKLQH